MFDSLCRTVTCVRGRELYTDDLSCRIVSVEIVDFLSIFINLSGKNSTEYSTTAKAGH